MALGGNDFLQNQMSATNRAVGTLGQTVFGTGGFLAFQLDSLVLGDTVLVTLVTLVVLVVGTVNTLIDILLSVMK
jgi:hypothetical protein